MVKVVTKDTFDAEVLNSSLPVVVDMFAEWCGPCKQLAPIFEDIAKEKESECVFVKVNIDNDRDLAVKYEVSSIPTLLFFRDGKLVSKENGFMNKEALLEKVAALCA